MSNIEYLAAVDGREESLIALSKKIWEYAEPGFKEVKSSRAIADYLEAEEFKVELGVGTVPTAIRAEYGSGHPVIAFLGEYDSLPNLNQKVADHRDPVYPDDPNRAGHDQNGDLGKASGVDQLRIPGMRGRLVSLSGQIGNQRIDGGLRRIGTFRNARQAVVHDEPNHLLQNRIPRKDRAAVK